MEKKLQHTEDNELKEIITFGSTITFSLNNFPSHYIYSEGFMISKLKLKKFEIS